MKVLESLELLVCSKADDEEYMYRMLGILPCILKHITKHMEHSQNTLKYLVAPRIPGQSWKFFFRWLSLVVACFIACLLACLL